MYNLVALKKCIEDMSKYHQIQVLKILKSNKNVNKKNKDVSIGFSREQDIYYFGN